MPSFRSSGPSETPGEPLSMMNAEKCSPSTFAKVGSRRGLGEGVGTDPLSGAEFGQVLRLLLVGAKVGDGQCADAGVAHEGDSPASFDRGNLGGKTPGDLAKREAAIRLGHLDREKTDVTRLAHQLSDDFVVELQ